ncbi:lipopolysaccharide biosynthesis protein [Geminocystis sp. GBBB08]|uniref:lipopolysaccharide biosynthesis protein n=1 Tax=Geminocystis sp. GBBB08 TaxID=2604140 RepID=UPI0027E3AA03|nr:lipopolysaccharide biosynthesis protein [Geminocystis sp. GBBB08]MBL1211255.1 lipopolysaccharide biosynthesis protein [Geminocystis sp. GBBB08]
MSLREKTIQGVFWSAIQNWGSQGISLVIFLILARLLAPQAWGLIAMANLVIDFLQLFLSENFRQTLIQKQTINIKEINTVFWTQIFLGFLFTLIIFILAGIIATFFRQPQLKLILQIFSFLFIISAFSQTQIALLHREFAFKTLALRSLFAIIISGIVGIVCAFNDYGLWSLVAQQLTYEIVALIMLWKVSDWQPQWQFSFDYLCKILSFSSNVLGYELIDFFNQRTDQLLIGYFLGEVALGSYAISHRILQVMTQLLIGSLNDVTFSIFSHLQEDKESFINAFYRATQLTCLIAFPVFCATIILSEELIITLFTEKWLNAIPILKILGFTGILRSISFVQATALVAMGKPSYQLKISLINTILNIILCVITVPWGVMAVALAYVISDYLVFPLSQWLLGKLISFSWRDYFSQFIPSLICTAIMALMILLCKNILLYNFNYQITLVISSLIGILTYSLGLLILFPVLSSSLLNMVKEL